MPVLLSIDNIIAMYPISSRILWLLAKSTVFQRHLRSTQFYTLLNDQKSSTKIILHLDLDLWHARTYKIYISLQNHNFSGFNIDTHSRANLQMHEADIIVIWSMQQQICNRKTDSAQPNNYRFTNPSLQGLLAIKSTHRLNSIRFRHRFINYISFPSTIDS